MSPQITTPDLAKPVVGAPIAIAFFDGDHNVHLSVAHVLSIGPIDEITNEPTISVAYPEPDANLSVLSSASWFKGYARATGVQHMSHPDVQDSKLSIGYGDPVVLTSGQRAEIPKPAGDAENPIFDRADDTVPTHVSLGQASLVQSAKHPRETVVSPLTSDLSKPDPLTKTSGDDKDAGDWTKTEGAGLTDNTAPAGGEVEVAPFSVGAKVHFSPSSGNDQAPTYTVKGIEPGEGINPQLFNTLEDMTGSFLPSSLVLATDELPPAA